jgi:hypothetical protein
MAFFVCKIRKINGISVLRLFDRPMRPRAGKAEEGDVEIID